jgi:hypothetical protein
MEVIFECNFLNSSVGREGIVALLQREVEKMGENGRKWEK